MDDRDSGSTNPRREMTRRDLIRRGAIVGGLVWTAPVIQSITTPASAGTNNVSHSCQSCCCCFTSIGIFQCSTDHFTLDTCKAHCAAAGGNSQFSDFCSGGFASYFGGACACQGAPC